MEVCKAQYFSEPTMPLHCCRDHKCCCFQCRPRVRVEYPPNLSILISGGKETNRDSLSKGD